MDWITIGSIGGSLLFTFIVVFIVFWLKKNEPLNHAEFFLKDRDANYIHILGARRIMPENGDSFDIFEHYVFDLTQMKYTKGGSQRGKNLDLKSEFVKRSLAQLSQKLNVQLAFQPVNEDFDDEEDGLLKVYRFESVQSDTEVYENLSQDCMVFVEAGDDADHFSLTIYRGGQQMKKHSMRGMSDYFFKTIYVDEKGWLCFLYRKQIMTRSGMAICIINYNSGEMVFDGFIQPKGK